MPTHALTEMQRADILNQKGELLAAMLRLLASIDAKLDVLIARTAEPKP